VEVLAFWVENGILVSFLFLQQITEKHNRSAALKKDWQEARISRLPVVVKRDSERSGRFLLEIAS
jgi:hypothetical protein